MRINVSKCFQAALFASVLFTSSGSAAPVLSWKFINPSNTVEPTDELTIRARFTNISSIDFSFGDTIESALPSGFGFGFNGNNTIGTWSAFPDFSLGSGPYNLIARLSDWNPQFAGNSLTPGGHIDFDVGKLVPRSGGVAPGTYTSDWELAGNFTRSNPSTLELQTFAITVLDPAATVSQGAQNYGFPLRSTSNVYLNSEVGGRNFLGGITETHTPENGYYSLDFDVNEGSAEVVAAADGDVVHVGALLLKGKYVPNIVIRHRDGHFTQYLEFDTADDPISALANVKADITVGSRVSKGDVLGILEAEGTSHLHFQARYDPTGSGLSAGLSTADVVELSNVAVGGRLFKDYKLPDPCVGECQAQIFGQALPLLPTSDPASDAFRFNVVVGDLGVGLELPIFVDPEIAVGYDYLAIDGPRFASVILPQVGDGMFELWLYDDSLASYVFEDIVNSFEQYFFPAGGVDRFRVLGIEVSEALSPTDPTAFVTGLTFSEAGPAEFTQTPIVVSIPAPPTHSLLVIAFLAGWGLRCRATYASRSQDLRGRHKQTKILDQALRLVMPVAINRSEGAPVSISS